MTGQAGHDPLWDEEDKPLDDQKIAVEEARLRGRRYNLDNRLYLVRGYDVFVVHSQDVTMNRRPDGMRDIDIKNARMVKYTEDGKRVQDKPL